MKIYAPNAEERAFLYQEASSLEPMTRDLGTLSVMVEDGGDSGYRVTFVVAPETVGLRVQATGANLFDATIAAKDETARQLNQVVNALTPEDYHLSRDPGDILH